MEHGPDARGTKMRITVRFFAILKDRAGVAETSLELPADATVRDALSLLVKRFPDIERDVKRIALAVNRAYVKLDEALRDGDELALIPPVSGG